ncbi:MAG: helix-turn-helix transcriptional regulator [Chitinophagales bacterium]|nr:helix-turn-helix transcriptional regulator [Hyphomicrobiales bacterium]
MPADAEGRVEVEASRSDSLFELFNFYIPPQAFAEAGLALEAGNPRLFDLMRPEAGETDIFLEALARSLTVSMASPAPLDRLLSDQIILTALINIAKRYASLQLRAIAQGGMTRWRLNQTLDRMENSIDSQLLLADLASDVGLSERHFCTAFSRSMGMSPHRYLLHRRIERAKKLLKSPDQSVLQIALD